MEESSVKIIRARLFRLLFISFVIVILVSILILIGAMIWVVVSSVNNSPLERMPVISRLEGYYLGNDNSWVGVEKAFSKPSDTDTGQSFWKWSLLLDQNDRVILNMNADSVYQSGDAYVGKHEDLSVNLISNGTMVGKVVLQSVPFKTRLRILSTVFIPIGIVGFFLMLFMSVSQYLIIRRIINPLSNTIAAAKEVMAGNLKARIDLTGPDDMVTLNRTFNQMVEVLDEANSKRQEFLADIAHELRTPLTIMHGRLEGILDHVYPADESHIAPILQETYLMERLVDDLRTLTLAETRQLRFDPKQVNLQDAIQRIKDAFVPLADAQNISINLNFPTEPLVALTDPQRFEQVMGNIINNSIKYIKNDGMIQIVGRQEASRVVLTISDNGPGVSEESLPYMFDRFWRKDKSRSRQTGGSGLGLAIAKQLVEAQGGTITASNHSPSGLSVRIELPASD